MQTQIEDSAHLFASIRGHFSKETYEAGLMLLRAQAKRFPNDAVNLRYLEACLEVRLGNSSGALGILEAAHGLGVWYGAQLMRESPSFAPLQGDPRFEQLVAQFAIREQAATLPRPVVMRPANRLFAEPTGALVAVHGNGRNARAFAAEFDWLIAEGWMVIAPESSQRIHSDGAVWDDLEQASADVLTQFRGVRDSEPLGPVVLVGFSMGADAALEGALSDPATFARIMLIGPPASGAGDHWNNRPLAAAPDLRVVILLGQRDEAVSHESVEALAEDLRAQGARCELRRIEALGHAMPPHEAIASGLGFLRDDC